MNLAARLAGLWPRTLFGRTAAALFLAFVVFEAIAFLVVWFAVITPLAERAADDLAAKIVLAGKTWVELPPQTRADYEIELAFRHDLELSAATDTLSRPAPGGFFARLLEDALSRRTGQAIRLMQGPDPEWDWLDLRVADTRLRVGFDRARHASDAPLAALGVFLSGTALTLLIALFLVRQLSRRLRQLGQFAAEVGQGRTPGALPETGAQELIALTAAFNRMAAEVQRLLENRTVLLSGISHDLRTPITRLRLALSMLEDADPVRVARMEADLAEMNQLITDMLTFARALQADTRTPCDLSQLLDELAAQAARLGPVHWPGAPACLVPIGEAALRRILANLLENARRYGGDMPIDLILECASGAARIGVLDRGPGIPPAEREAVFRPFYRLESSRARDSGGSGLGLAIVAQLASAYGWTVTLEDRDDGGLAAWVTLTQA